MIKELFSELIPLQERMHRKSKKKFREYLKTKAEINNLEYKIFPNSFASKNVVIGNLKTAKYVLGAHYDTPPRMPVFMMKNLILFNLISILIVPLIIFVFIYFEINLTFAILIYILTLLHLLGFGIANKYNYNDNTSGILTLLSLMHKLKRTDVCYVFYDNEEKGLIGSLQLATILQKSGGYQLGRKVFINFDCVGRGEVFGVVSFKRSKQIASEIISLNDDKKLQFVHRKASIFEGSDHFSFRNWNSLGIMCYNKKGKKLGLNNIHSHKDRNIDLDNINTLVCVIEKYISKEDERNG